MPAVNLVWILSSSAIGFSFRFLCLMSNHLPISSLGDVVVTILIDSLSNLYKILHDAQFNVILTSQLYLCINLLEIP